MKVVHKSTGPMGYPVDITNPAVEPAVSNAGYGKMMAAKPSGPYFMPGPKGYNAPMDSPKALKGRGGSSKAGPAMTQGGTQTPSFKPGPKGFGETGSNYPPP